MILGSGGFKTIPQPLCECSLCKAARKNKKFRRTGPSFYVPQADFLVDLSAESKEQIDQLSRFPKHIAFSHWHPDHTEGYRVLESFPNQPKVYIQSDSKILERVPALKFLAGIGKIKIVDWPTGQNLNLNGFKVSSIKINSDIPVYAFLVKKAEKRILLCPDHSRHLLDIAPIKNLDMLIMNIGVFDKIKEMTNFDDNLNIIAAFSPKKTVLTHVEEQFQIDKIKQVKIEKKYKDKKLSITKDNQILEI